MPADSHLQAFSPFLAQGSHLFWQKKQKENLTLRHTSVSASVSTLAILSFKFRCLRTQKFAIITYHWCFATGFVGLSKCEAIKIGPEEGVTIHSAEIESHFRVFYYLLESVT